MRPVRSEIGDALATAIREAVREEVRAAMRDVQSEQPSEWMTKEQVAKLLGVTTRSIASYSKAGLPVHYVGRLARYRRDEVDAWVERNSRKLRVIK